MWVLTRLFEAGRNCSSREAFAGKEANNFFKLMSGDEANFFKLMSGPGTTGIFTQKRPCDNDEI